MYYWNTKELADQIKEGSISEKEKKNYFIVMSIIVTLSGYSFIGSEITNSVAIFVMILLDIVITIFGINITFNTNQGNEGSDYIARVTMLSLPILIKLFVYSFFGVIIVVCVLIAAGASGKAEVDLDQWPMVLASAVFGLIFFWRINVHLRRMNT